MHDSELSAEDRVTRYTELLQTESDRRKRWRSGLVFTIHTIRCMALTLELILRVYPGNTCGAGYRSTESSASCTAHTANAFEEPAPSGELVVGRNNSQR